MLIVCLFVSSISHLGILFIGCVRHRFRILSLYFSTVSGTMSSRASRTLYVGNLPGDIREREVEDLFHKVISSVCDWIGCMYVDI